MLNKAIFFFFFFPEIILLPFGPDASDELLRDTFDQSSVDSNRRLVDQEMLSRTIRPETGFPFGGTFYPALYVSCSSCFLFLVFNTILNSLTDMIFFLLKSDF